MKKSFVFKLIKAEIVRDTEPYEFMNRMSDDQLSMYKMINSTLEYKIDDEIYNKYKLNIRTNKINNILMNL